LTVPENPSSEESWIAVVAVPPAEAMVNALEPGARVTATAVPLRATVCGDPPALSVTVSVPVREPATVGVKVTAMVQLAPGATLVPQLLFSAKSPEAAIEVSARATCPEFVRVTAWAAVVVPTVCWANVRLVGESVTVGPAGAVTTTDTAEAEAEEKFVSPA
jgi:hypothetical protein